MTECHAVESGVAAAPVNSSAPNPLLWSQDMSKDPVPPWWNGKFPSVQTLQAWAGDYDREIEKARQLIVCFEKQAKECRNKVREIENSALAKVIAPPPGLDLNEAKPAGLARYPSAPNPVDHGAAYEKVATADGRKAMEASMKERTIKEDDTEENCRFFGESPTSLGEPKKIAGLPRHSSDDSTASNPQQGSIPELSGLEGIPETLAKAFAAKPHTFQAQTVESLEQVQTPGVCCFRWTISAKKLNGSDQSSVSPVMMLPSGRDQQLLPFKMIIYAKPSSSDNGRGGASFRKAKGRGMIKLKSEATCSPGEDHTLPALTFWLSVGSGRAPGALDSYRGPVTHDFAKTATGGLNTDQEAWEFVKLVDKATDTFVVCLALQTPPQ